MNSEKELVSIVIATYNGEKYLQEQLDSIFQQTYKNLEIIAVDDASTDNTLQILNAYSLKYDNMNVFANKANIGYIKNFEKGFMLSSGNFIAPCDQDDVWHADKIKLLVEAINDCVLAYCDSFVCNERLETDGKKISDRVHFTNLNNCLQQAVFSRIYGNTILFKHELLKKIIPFTEILPHDWWITFNATIGGCIKFLDKPMVYYRQHTQNAIGAINRGEKSKQQSEVKNTHFAVEEHRKRVELFYKTCPDNLKHEKDVLRNLNESYKDFSFKNNFKRMMLFFRYKDLFLAAKKHSWLQRNLFPVKMFFKVK
ncbi:MAG: glycosyltransferase family 2 protein [Parafilimonas sp.]|nr:glycosyltransferase family 2 protein [Parafilimonas sp.]